MFKYQIKWKLRVDTIILFFAVISQVQIYSFPDSVRNIIRLISVIICMIYCGIHIKGIIKKPLIGLYLFFVISFYAAYINHYPSNMISFQNSLIYIATTLIGTLTFYLIAQIRGVQSLSSIVVKVLLIYWIVNSMSIITIGAGDFAGNNVYFIGNKFNTVYLNIFILFFMGLDSLKKKQGRLILRTRVWLFWGISVIEALYLSAFTGLTMLLVIALLFIINNGLVSFIHISSKYRVFYKPGVIVLMVMLSGIIAFGMEWITGATFVKTILDAIGKSQTFGSRLTIYSYLAGIIVKEPWLGYGYDTNIVTTTYAANAQNGLIKIIIENGLIGCIAFLFMTYLFTKKSDKVKDLSCDWVLYTIYAFIISAVVEITYFSYFFIILVLYRVLIDEKLMGS